MNTLPTDVLTLSVPPVLPGHDTEAEFEIDYDSLVTEDHKPVDRIFIEKLYRLWTRPPVCQLARTWTGTAFPGADRRGLVLPAQDTRGSSGLPAQPGRDRPEGLAGQAGPLLLSMGHGQATRCRHRGRVRQGRRRGVVQEEPLRSTGRSLLRGLRSQTHPLQRNAASTNWSAASTVSARPAPGRPSGSAYACGRVSSRGSRTPGCAGAMPTAISFRPARSGPRRWPFASKNWKRNCAG